MPESLQNTFKLADPNFIEYWNTRNEKWQKCLTPPGWCPCDAFRLITPLPATQTRKENMTINPYLYNPNSTVLGEMPQHIQDDLKAINNGKNIEYRNSDGWTCAPDPTWKPYQAYRLKPGWKLTTTVLVKPFLTKDCICAIKSPRNKEEYGLKDARYITGFIAYMYNGEESKSLELDIEKHVIIPEALKFEV
jgi:hypothetical protein